MSLTPNSSHLAVAAVVVAVLVPLIWPGDIPFINDEPQLIANAGRANADRRLAPLGLDGTYGFTDGPVPTWVYQALLSISHDLIVGALSTHAHHPPRAFAPSLRPRAAARSPGALRVAGRVVRRHRTSRAPPLSTLSTMSPMRAGDAC